MSMSVKEILSGSSVRHRVIIDTAKLLDRAVGITLGPKGRGVMIEQPYGAPKITKDGATVAKSIVLKDKFMNMVAQLINQVAARTAEEAGDGTTTATILACAMLIGGVKRVAAGMNPMDIKRGIDKGVVVLVEALKKLSKPCKGSTAIAQVGTISANSDSAVGKIIAEAMEKVGETGVITIEKGSGLEDELEVVEGMQLDRGYISPYFVNNQKNMTCELENPYILLVEKKISRVQDLLNVLESVAKTGRPLFIIAEDVEGEALATLIINHMRGNMKVCAVKSPGFGDRRKDQLRDIAVLTRAEVISEEIGLSMEKAGLEHLGSAKRVEVSKDNFTIVGGQGDGELIKARISELGQQEEMSKSSYDKEKIRERAAKLGGGVAVIKLGGGSEAEMDAKEGQGKDALNAARAAVEEGIMPGGGVALLRILDALDGVEVANEDQKAGITVLKEALYAPLLRIVENAGDGRHRPDVVAQNIRENKSGIDNYGFNAATGEYGDMIKMGILDPAKVIRFELQKAASVAGMIIITECMIVEQPKNDEAKSSGGMGGGMNGMGGGMGDMDMM